MIFGSSKTIALALFRKGAIGCFTADEGVFWWGLEIELFLYVWYQCLCYALFLAENVWRKLEVWVIVHSGEYQHDMFPPGIWLELLHHTVEMVQNSHDTITQGIRSLAKLSGIKRYLLVAESP